MADTIVAPRDAAAPLASNDPDGFPVQRAKAQRPPLRTDTLHRARLLDWLGINVHHRLVLLVAEAGYGKTTLLADFAQQTRLRTLWFRVDDDDRDWVSALHYLVAAGREVDPTFASRTAERLAELGPSGGARDEIVRTFLSELGRLGDEPTVLIVDDYHVLDDSPDARSVIADLILHAPERFSIVLATRRRPSVPIARLRALGEVAELTTDDLRFTEPETEALFRDAYRQPLDADVLSDLARRTEGWAASLQLVRAAVRERSSVQIRAFVRGLTALDENLYDYLAEEVVGELDPAMQDFLMRTSILQLVDPGLAEVAAGVPQTDARRLIEASERIGLLSRRGELGRHTVRYHPLVREFLEDRFRRDVGEDAVRTLHRTVARHAETTDWRLAAHHYAAAGDTDDVRRVVTQSLADVVAGGDLVAARDFLVLSGNDVPSPALDVISARIAASHGPILDVLPRAHRAWRLSKQSSGVEREVALFTLMYLQLESGDIAGALDRSDELLDVSSDPSIREIASAMRPIVDAAQEGSLLPPIARLQAMLEHQLARGQTYFAGVTALNLAAHFKVAGDSAEASKLSRQAIQSLEGELEPPALSAAHAMLGWALAHDGDESRAWAEFDTAGHARHPATRITCRLEHAEALAWYGDAGLAEDLIAEAIAERDDETRGPALDVATAEVELAAGRADDARDLLRAVDINVVTFECGQKLRHLTAAATAAVLMADDDAGTAAQAALTLARRQHAPLYVWRNEILVASLTSPADLDVAVRRVAARDRAVLSISATVILGAIGDLSDAAFDAVRAEALARPNRWAPAIRRLLGKSGGIAAVRLGRLLDSIGNLDDVVPLRQLAKRLRLTGEDVSLGLRLARRLAPVVEILDQDRVRIRVGEQVIAGTDVRRKVLALLCFLVSRPEMSATKEQVADALWPELGWESASNSLNQTTYFLRRVFDPRYKEGVSAEYLHHDSDILWLDPELVASQTGRTEELLQRVRGEATPALIDELTRSYTGQFALDFMYEDWAAAYRNRVHTKFLEVMERFVERSSQRGAFGDAIWAARAAIDVDPSADRLEEALIRLYRVTGASSAAAEQYAHYTSVLRNELGVEPPPLEKL